MGKFTPHGTLVAKGFEGGANLLAAERGEMVYAGFPTERPLQCGDQFAGQAKRQVETAYPWPWGV